MLKYFYFFLLLFFFINPPCFSQKINTFQLEEYKEKFYLNRKIGVDSSLYYMNKMLTTDIVSYKTFAYAAIEYLKTREKQPVNVTFFKDHIAKNLHKIEQIEKNYTILFDIHILLGNTSKRRGQMKSALLNYIKAENYAIKAKDIERIIKIKGNIALIYQDMNELNEALFKIKQKELLLEENKKKLGDKYLIQKNKTSLNIGAIYATLYSNNTKNHHYADSSMYYYNRVLNNNNFKDNSYNLGRVYYSLGTLYNLKKEYSKANHFLEESLKIFKKNKLYSHLYKGHYNIGLNYYMVEDFKKAKNNFLKALRIKNDTLLDYNYININNFLAKIYSHEKKSDSADYYLNVFLNVYNRISEREKQEFKETYKIDKEVSFNKKINALNTNISQKSYYNNIIVISLILSLALIIFLVVKNINEKKKAKKRLEELLIKVSTKEKDFNIISTSNIKIRSEQQERIIKGLSKLEENLDFLKDDFNLYNVAKKIGSNTTYLSKGIKEWKQMSFSEYTNELRINYIISRLREEKRIRAYTTQAIGEIGGYKNAKSFIRIFKKYTGITPYQFIEKISKETII